MTAIMRNRSTRKPAYQCFPYPIGQWRFTFYGPYVRWAAENLSFRKARNVVLRYCSATAIVVSK